MSDWRNRVVVITGASAGVRRALARRVARRGASLGLIARGVEGLDGAPCEAELAGVRVLAVSVRPSRLRLSAAMLAPE